MAIKKTRASAEVVYGGAGAGWTALKWTIARIPFDMAKTWPVRKGRRVRGEIEGFAFRTTLFPRRGGGEDFLLVNKKMQAGAGLRAGKKAQIWLEPDLEEREIVLPVELKKELNSDRGLRKWFDGLSDSMRREIGKWADEPKGCREPAEACGKNGGAADAGDGGGTGTAAGAEGDLSAAAAGAGGLVCADARAAKESSAGHFLL